MTVKEFRSKRIAANIPAIVVAARAGKNRSWLSSVERGHLQPTEEDLQRLDDALKQLIEAKSAIEETAAAVGWPGVVR